MDDDRRAPLELPRLRQWLGYLTQSYDDLDATGGIGYCDEEKDRYRDALASVAQTCEGDFDRPLKARIRELLALGVAGYGLTGGLPAGAPLSRQMIVDLATCSLWPLASALTLPKAWLGAFITVTRSAQLATPIVRARYRCRVGEDMTPQEFGEAVAEVDFAWGVRHLLHDLADPRRGGCALTPMVIASTRYAPRRGATQGRVAKWALLTALDGMASGGPGVTPAPGGGWLAQCLQNPRRPYPLSPGHPGPEPTTQPAARPTTLPTAQPTAQPEIQPETRPQPAVPAITRPQPAVPAMRDEPWPATLTGGTAGRPVILGRR